MKPEDKSKLRSLTSDIAGLKSRTPDEKKFSEWKKDVEKKLEGAFGKNSDELSRFKRIRFFNFTGHGRTKDAPVSESECREYIRALDEARRLLQHIA
ncbi:MAG: hypothetical protein KAU31_09420 [Spirochaetaceae bacterium]|nr:hypothetical protein [Spirochaetaceae bacterium]